MEKQTDEADSGLGEVDDIHETAPVSAEDETLELDSDASEPRPASWKDRLKKDLKRHERERDVLSDLLPSERFKVERELGKGGMGVVLEARDKTLNRRVAVKVMRPGTHESSAHLERFRIEARAAARLRHPNVVTVHDVGEENGRPFLVMDLIEGESLAERLKRDGVLEPREAAEIIRAVAKALHYAHSNMILHRDIKPGNILIAKSDGRPLLTDFGLAKEIESAFDGPTASGDVMGTPAFMAPEQAAGELERVDRRADLYALGATLYMCLVGHPPFTDPQLPKLLRAVAEQEPPPPSRVRPGIDRDLETICLKLLEKDPEARYGSGRELAEELKRYLRHESIIARRPGPIERLGNWRRRNRAVAATGAAAAAIGAVVILVGSALFADRLRGERDVARRESERATSREKIAKDALQFLVGEVEAQLEDLPGARVREVRMRLQNAAVEKLIKLQETQDAGAPISIEANDAWRQIGDLALSAGNTKRAEAAYRQAERIARGLLKRNERRVATRMRLALTLNGLGRARSTAGQPAEALKAYEEALGLFRGLAGHDATEKRYRGGLVQTLNGIGVARLALRDLEASLAAHEQALGMARELEDKSFISISLNRVGHARLKRGDAAGAASAFQESLTLARKQLEEEPHSLDARRSVCSALDMAANARRQQGELPAAEKLAEESLTRRQALVAEDPSNAEFRRELGISQERLGELYRQSGRMKEARESYQDAVKIRRMLLADDPSYDNRESLLHGLVEVGKTSRTLGDVATAKRVTDEVLEVCRALLKEAPDNRSPTGNLMRALAQKAELLADEKDHTGALEHYEQSLKVTRGELERDPTNDGLRGDLLVNLDRVGGMHMALKQLEKASAVFSESLTLARALATSDPTNAQVAESVANALHTLGQVQQAQGKVDDALKSYQGSEQAYEGVLTKAAKNVDPRRALAIVQGRIATIAQAKGDLKGAVAGFKRSIETMKALLELSPKHAPARRDLSVTLFMAGGMLRDAGDTSGANELLQAAVKNHEILVKQAPQFQPELEHIAGKAKEVELLEALYSGTRKPKSSAEHCILAEARYQQGKFAESTALYEQAFLDASIKGDLQQAHLYNGACAAARAGRADQAMAWLTEDVSNRRELLPRLDARGKQAMLAHFDHAKVKDPDLVTLRDRADFKALFAD